MFTLWPIHGECSLSQPGQYSCKFLAACNKGEHKKETLEIMQFFLIIVGYLVEGAGALEIPVVLTFKQCALGTE